MAITHILVPHGDNGVEGKGPEPRKPWRFPRERRRESGGVDAIKAATLRAQADAKAKAQPGFTRFEQFGEASDEHKARLTASEPVYQGKNLREAGINVPLRVTIRKVYYPFGVKRVKHSSRRSEPIR